MHFNFQDIVSEIADGSWGRDFPDREAAAKAVVADDQLLTAHALMELLRRLNAIGRAAGDARFRDEANELTVTEGSAVFPDKSVGDRLYDGDLEDGISEYVIIAKDAEHHCLVICLHDFDLRYPPSAFIANKDMKETSGEAISCAAESDFKWHGERHKRAKAAIEAVKSGKDPGNFMKTFDEAEVTEAE